MKLLKITLALFIAGIFASCNINFKYEYVKGNGNVITAERPVTRDFHSVKGSSGLDVYLTEGDENKIVVEADENLHKHIIIEITDGKMHIKTSNKNIRSAKAKKVYVTYTSLESVEASSGADVKSTTVITAENLYLRSSSGADLEVEVYAKELTAESSSGADIKILGNAKNLYAKASSGSDLNAKSLETLNSEARVSSGASIIVNAQNNLDAKATSGGSIKYYGEPSQVNINKSASGGSIKKM